MTSVGASARNAVAVVSASMEGVRVGAKSVVAGARYVSTESGNVSVRIADTSIFRKKRARQVAADVALQIVGVPSKKTWNYHLVARFYNL